MPLSQKDYLCNTNCIGRNCLVYRTNAFYIYTTPEHCIFTLPPSHPLQRNGNNQDDQNFFYIDVISTILDIFICIWKKYGFKISLIQVCFQNSQFLNCYEEKYSETCLEIASIHSSKTVWAHFMYVTLYPARL